MDTLNIIIDGKKLNGFKDETILETANRHNIHIPTLCNDPRLAPYTSCFVCVVEVEGMKGLQPSCSTKIQEGMVVTTSNEKVKKARKKALDLLVSNHYADCLAPCKLTCPAGVDVQGYISLIEKGLYSEAVGLIKEVNPLPAICGRVCVRPCEVACRRNLLEEGTGVGIDYLKRFAADFDLNAQNGYKPDIKTSTGKKVAVIGAGPGGLSTAWFLQKEGHQVDIFEAHPYSGGMLRYGIPPYRLPNDIIQKETDKITELGAKVFYNKKLGDNISYKEIENNYDACVLTIGSQKGTKVGCEGDDAENVFSGIDFLRNMEATGQKPDFSGKKVAVVGGGNTAMDCCRTAMRLGAAKVYVVYRRTEKEMPANPIEIHESKVEGIEYLFLNNPAKINKDDEGKLKSMTLIKMELGEPDASGRRRPVPVEGSEYDIELDYVLAAIGQKTAVDFIDDINENSSHGSLKLNRWGNIDADEKTLQTDIECVFAAGDGVTGPATLIEAIAQARKASHSVMQYLAGEKITGLPSEFISKKDHFKTQLSEDYKEKYKKQLREEMPLIPAKERQNFNEVELGYLNEDIAKHETARCLECGCSEYFTCDLKKYCTEYEADQNLLKGDYQEKEVDFSHPFIEIDNNKCILCARCVRICRDVVGANALGLVNRGFETYVAPSMGESLKDTHCESCGLCLSTCPTGALTENVPFKPGPVQTDSFKTICNYCSIGCEINLHHKNNFFMKVTGANGMVNNDGNLCRFAKFGYHYLNDQSRLTLPRIKTEDGWKEIGFDEAFNIIKEKVSAVKPDDNMFFAGARLSNEEIYNIQKLARAAVGTNNVSSFHYLTESGAYRRNTIKNTPFEQISEASKIYLIGSELSLDNAVAGFKIFNASRTKDIPVCLITDYEYSPLEHKVNECIKTEDYFAFIKACNHYLLSEGKENMMFINDHCKNFNSYKEKVLEENYQELIKESGISQLDIEAFANDYNLETNAIIVFSEKELSTAECSEIFNLSNITGKTGKTASGLISLKEKNNAQGLFDMGANPEYTVGSLKVELKETKELLKKAWDCEIPGKTDYNILARFMGSSFKNMFIFGEDPVGCSINEEELKGWLEETDFVMVQDYFMTPTAECADMVLPASLPFETGGSFTNTQKYIQIFEKEMNPKTAIDNLQQLAKMAEALNVKLEQEPEKVREEALQLIAKAEATETGFVYNEINNDSRMFEYGCDYLVKRFEEEFDKAFEEE